MYQRKGKRNVGALSAALALWSSTVLAASPVADAAMAGNLDRVMELIGEGANVDGAQGDGMTALHWAARRGDAKLARTLISAGAGLETPTRLGGHRPLHVAAKAGRASVVAVLVEAGADVRASTETGATPLHFAAAAGSAEAVACLLGHGAEPNPRETLWGQTPLMFAAAAGRADVIRVLLADGADPAVSARVIDVVARSEVDRADRQRHRLRVAALRAGDAAAAAALASLPRPPSASAPSSVEVRGGEPVPLNYAALVGTHGGLTPLLLAARGGHAEAAIALVDGGADIDQVSAADRTSPMLIAMINGHFDLAMRLFERGADPSLASDAGATPLYAALNVQWAPKSRHPQPTAHMQQETDYLKVMQRLLETGVDPNVRLKKTLWYTTYNRDLLGVDRTGATPFWRAAYALDIPAMKLLLRYGADPNVPTIKVPERRDPELDVWSDGDASGLPPIPMGGPAVYPIHAASGVGYGQGFAGNSHRHVPDGFLPAVKFLVEELGADVNQRDHNGFTPLHHAAARGDNELILYLVSRGADPTAVSRSGQTTADMANGPVQRVQPFPETVALLESLGSKNSHRCVSC